MNALYHAKVALCLTASVAVGFVGFALVGALGSIQRAAEAVPVQIIGLRSDVQEGAKVIRGDVSRGAMQASMLAVRQVSLLRKDLTGEIRELRSGALIIADRRIGEVTTPLGRQINELGATANGTLLRSQSLIGRYERIPDDVALNTRPLWDCREYSGCVTSQSLALIGSARATLGVVARNAPRMADHAERIATDSENISRNVGIITLNFAEATKVPPLWQRVLLRWAPAGAQIATPFVVR